MGVPLRLKDASGNLQEFTTGEEAYLSYLASLQLLEDSAIGSLNTSSGTSIGSYSNTFFNQAVGTHPSTSITIGTTTTTVYQNLGTALEDSADWRRPIEWKTSGTEGVNEMDDTSLNAAVDRYLSYIFTNDLPGSYKLATSAPAGYTAAVSPVFTDTRTDGTSIAYSLYRRTSFTPPTTKSALHLKRAGDTQAGAYDDGIEEMTVQEMKTTFGQRAKTRINASGIGKYQLRTSSQGVPTDPGTWVSKGSATDTRQEIADEDFTRESTNTFSSNFTRNSTSDFEGNYQATYTGDFLGNYINNFLIDYNTDYATVYEPAAYVSNFSRVRATVYTGDFLGNFVGNYASDFLRTRITDFTGDFTGNFIGDFISNYERNFTRQRVTDYTGNFIGDFISNYERLFQRTRITDFTGDFTGNYTGDFISNYERLFQRTRITDFIADFTGDFTGNYTGNFIVNYTRAITYYYERIYTGGPFTRFVQYVRDFVRNVNYERSFDGNFLGNYLSNFTRDSIRAFGSPGIGPANLQAYSGPGDFENIVFLEAGFRTSPLSYGGNTFGANYVGPTAGNARAYLGPPNGNVPLKAGESGTPEERGTYGASFEGPIVYIKANYYTGPGGNYSRIGAYVGYAPIGSQFMYFSHGDTDLVYVGPLTLGSGSSYSRLFLGNYARNFTRTSTRTSIGNYNRIDYYQGNYQRLLSFSDAGYAIYTGGNYARTVDVNFQRDFLRTSTRNSTRNSTTTFTGDFLGDYTGGNYERNFTRVSTRNSTTVFQGNFLGDYTGGNYERNFTRDSTTVFTGNFDGNYLGGNYERNFTRDSTRNSTTVFTGNFEGNYQRNFTRDSTRNSTNNFTGDFEGNYQSDYVGTYERIYTTAYQNEYETDFTRNSTSDFNINYNRLFTGDFEGNYQKDFVGNFLGNFLGETIQSSSQTIETYTLYVRIA